MIVRDIDCGDYTVTLYYEENNFKRKLEVGDKICCQGITSEIAEILYQDFDKNNWSKEDSSISIEFRDTNGVVRNWKSHIDGGYVIWKEDAK